MSKEIIKSYSKSLCENYKDFVFIFDSDLGVYVVKCPKDDNIQPDTQDTVFVNVTPENQCDTIDDVIAYVDDYYNGDDLTVSEDDNATVEESINEDTEDSLRQMFGDIFSVVLTRADDGENEAVEFNDIKQAQEYIDDLKRDNDDFFSKAVLVNEDGKVLDSWEYVPESDRRKPKDETADDAEQLNEDAVDEEPTEDSDPVEDADVTAIDDVNADNEPETDANAITNNRFSAICNAACAANMLLCNMKTLHWNVAGEHFDVLHDITLAYAEKASEDLDMLAELSLELGCPVYNPAVMCLSLGKQIINVNDGKMLNREFVLNAITENITNYIDAVKSIYNIEDLSSDVLSEIDSIVRYWTKELNYKQPRRQFAN